jgi:hypothetical protein
MSANPKDQWVVFDLGQPHAIYGVLLDLWGSDANPKNCTLASSSNEFERYSNVRRLTATALQV